MNMIRSVLFLVLLCSVSVSQAQWVQTSGPSGGAITSVAVLGGDVFAGTAQGVFRSTDGGVSWNNVTASSGNPSIQALAVLDTDVFAATTTGVLRSTNKGVTWAAADRGFSGYPLVLSAQGSSFFLTTEYNSVFRSSNLGTTWTSVTTLNDSAVTCFTSIGGMLFAGTELGEVLASTDNGVTWSATAGVGLPGTYFSYLYSLVAMGADLFAATDSGIFISKDSGAIWSDLGANFAGLSGASILAVDSSELLAGTYQGGLYFSYDTGNTWTTASSGVTSLTVTAIAPFGTTILAGTQSSGVFISMDGGANWNADDSGIVISNVISLAALGPYVFANCFQPYGSSSGSLFLTGDAGQDWTDITSNLNSFGSITAIAAYDGQVFAATDNSAVDVSPDSGVTWSSGSTLGYFEIDGLFPTSNGLFAATSNGMFQSPDEGSTWLSASSGIAAGDLGLLSFAAGTSAYYCGSTTGAVYVSTDSGEIWNNITPPSSFDSVNAIAVTNTGAIISGSASGVFVSADQGATWSDPLLSSYEITSLLSVGSNVFAGTTGGIFVSTDGGRTWNNEDQGLTILSVTALVMNGVDLYAGTTGGGVWRRPLSEMIKFSSVRSNDVTASIEQSYPNPFTQQTTIPFSLTQTEHVSVTIFNMLGQEITTLADQDFGAGPHEVVWNAGRMPSGSYVCRIATSEGVQTQSLVLETSGLR